MKNQFEILTAETMRKKYGLIYENAPKLNLKKDNIPKALWSLISYAEFWGISDDLIREDLVANMSQESIDNLAQVVTQYEDEIDEWLSGPESNKTKPSDEYIAFSAMRMVVDFL